jgi:hypothetical protein
LPDRARVRSQEKFPTGERAYEHEQRGSWQMKIRQQPMDLADLGGWVDEDVSRAMLPDEFVIATGGGLKHSNRCRPDRHDPLGGIDRGRRRLGNRKSLFVHAVIGDLLCLNRLESSGADMQRNERMRHLGQNPGGEMQPRGRRGDGAGHFRENSLIPL